jgi:Ni,Fe-hydrogenase III large subunit
VRQDHASGYYRFSHIPVSTYPSGDVFARAFVRWLEVKESVQFVLEHLSSFPREKTAADRGKIELRPEALSVSMVEGWRGEICHVAITDKKGRFRKYKIVDPSFHNWSGLAMAMRGEGISNFPLCNKSFNLSYCGFDL